MFSLAAQAKKPTVDALKTILTPLSLALAKVVEFRDKNRSHPHFNHLSVISEGIPALGWVSVVRISLKSSPIDVR